MIPIQKLEIEGVVMWEVTKFQDQRGWLMETFRLDFLEEAGLREYFPVMSYISLTLPGIARGPHEHLEQSDFFAFLGPSDFEVHLWDNRPESSSYGLHIKLLLGESHPACLIVPPRVVHAYKNVGGKDGLVLNFPNRLYAGRGKKEPVDEVRHENDPNSRFKLEDAP
ncbi:MAG: dTDP-4-dehydrorhamnose 3,5-epimerase family protein [bacterium]